MHRIAFACSFAVLGAVLAGTAMAYNNGAAATPIMGWNTWCTYDMCGLIDKCSDSEVRQQARALVSSGMRELGYKYVTLDDCWADKTRDENGNLRPNPKRFPYGMKPLVDYVHSLGLKIGVYTCIGTHTCRNGLPGSWGHFKADAQTFAGWELDFVKCDNCNKPSGYTEFDMYSNFSHELNATGRPMVFALCEWGDQDVQKWGPTIAQSYRIQMDHLPFFDLPTHADGQGFGQGVKNIIQYIATLKPSTFVRQYGWMDPDFLMTDYYPTMTTRYSRVELTLWTMWSAPMLVATQLSNMSDSKKELLTNTEIIAIDQDASYTAADMVKNISAALQLWARPLANGDAAVVIVNLNDYLWKEPGYNVTVAWTDFGVTGTVTRVRDLWAHMYLPQIESTYSTFIDASDVRYFRLTCQPQPCIVRNSTL